MLGQLSSALFQANPLVNLHTSVIEKGNLLTSVNLIRSCLYCSCAKSIQLNRQLPYMVRRLSLNCTCTNIKRVNKLVQWMVWLMCNQPGWRWWFGCNNVCVNRGWLWARPQTSGPLTPVRLTAGYSGTGEETDSDMKRDRVRRAPEDGSR